MHNMILMPSRLFMQESDLAFGLKKSEVKGKVLVCNGADDTFIPESAITNFKSKMDSAEVDYTYISYEGAVHGFTSREADENGKNFGINLAYHPEADSASWEEMKVLFSEVL